MFADIALEKYYAGYKVSNIFLDPLGSHLFVSITNKTGSELLYIYGKNNNNRPKKLDKFKNFEITAIGFNTDNTVENKTGLILLGTNNGLIIETDIVADGDRVVQNCHKEVFDVGRGESCPITGIEFYKINSTYVVLVTTIERLYKFYETFEQDEKSFTLQNIFNPYLSIPEQIKDYQEIKSQLSYSQLNISYNNHTKCPRGFGWLTQHGIYFGEINSQSISPAYIVSNEIVPYPNHYNGSVRINSNINEVNKNVPISFVLTDFHALLVFPDHVTAVSLLNYEVVYEEYFTEQFGKIIGAITDHSLGSIYIYTSKYIFLYCVSIKYIY